MSNKYNSYDDTLDHISKVLVNIYRIVANLKQRGFRHDDSKLYSPEKEAFDIAIPKLKDCKYGSDEYKATLKEMGAALKHHYEMNDHHVEHARAKRQEWRPVVGYETIYEVSNFGDVRSLDRIVQRDSKQGDMQIRGKLLIPHINPKGYLRLQLSDGTPQSFLVHRLVAQAFIPNLDNKPYVNHINGNKRDNFVDNLEWVTPSENLQHAYDNGLKQPAVKYVVICKELNIYTYGLDKMVEELSLLGYKASSAGIWNCLSGDAHTHAGLTFESRNIEEYEPESDIRFMSFMAILEMLADWKAANDRTNSNFNENLAYNLQRFNVNSDLAQIFWNTARELEWVI